MRTSLGQPSSWLISACGLILYVWAPASLDGLSLLRTPAPPPWVALAAPLVVYAMLCGGLRRLTTQERVAGTVALYGVHFLLGFVTDRIYAEGLTLLGPPLDQARWTSATAPLLQLLAVPLVAWPFRDLIGDRRGAGAVVLYGAGEDVTPPRARVTPPPGRVTPPAVRVPPPSAAPARRVTPVVAPVSPRRLIFAHPAQAERDQSPAETSRPAPAPPPPAGRVVEAHTARPVLVEAPRQTPAEPASAGTVTVPPVIAPPPAAPVSQAPLAVPAPPTPAAGPAVLAAPATVEPRGIQTAASAATVEEPARPTTPALPAAAAPGPMAGEPTPGLTVSAAEIAEAQRLCAPLPRFGSLKVDVQVLMGVTLWTACPGRLARDAVVRDAFRVLSRLGDCPGLGMVDQVTLRGSAGVMVLTPLGSLAHAGPVLNVVTPQRGLLALLEILSGRVAAEYRQTHPAAPDRLAGPATVPPAPDLAEIATPSGMGPIARTHGGGTGVAPLALRDPVGQLSLYLFLAPGLDGPGIGRVACQLRTLMEIDGHPGGIGAIRSIVLRLGDQRLVIHDAAASASSLLVSAGPASAPPGLVHRELDRAAERLAPA